MTVRSAGATLILLIACAGTAWAGDVLTMPSASGQAADQHAVKQPVHGMTMQNVTQVFGAPVKKVAAVGDPPISRWIYPHFVVYFERDIVLHTVSKATPFHDAPPAPAVAAY